MEASKKGAASLSVPKPKGAPKFPKNSSRSLSPQVRNGRPLSKSSGSSTRSRSALPSTGSNHSRKETTNMAAGESLLDKSQSQRQKSPLKKTKSAGVVGPTMNSRRGRKTTLSVSKSTSKLPAPSIKTELDLDSSKKNEAWTSNSSDRGRSRSRSVSKSPAADKLKEKLTINANANSLPNSPGLGVLEKANQHNTQLDEDDTIFSQEGPLPPTPRPSNSSANNNTILVEGSSRAFPVDQWVQAGQEGKDNSSNLPDTNTTADKKKIPPKQRSKGARRKPAGSPAPFKRSSTSDGLTRHHTNTHTKTKTDHEEEVPPPAPQLRRTVSLQQDRQTTTTLRGQKPSEHSSTHTTTSTTTSTSHKHRKLSPPHNRYQPTAFKGRAESILNHSLLGDSQHGGSKLDMSFSAATLKIDESSSTDLLVEDTSTPNHQRRAGGTSTRKSSLNGSLRDTSSNSAKSSTRRRGRVADRQSPERNSNNTTTSSGTSPHRSPTTADKRDKLRRTRSKPEGSSDGRSRSAPRVHKEKEGGGEGKSKREGSQRKSRTNSRPRDTTTTTGATTTPITTDKSAHGHRRRKKSADRKNEKEKQVDPQQHSRKSTTLRRSKSKNRAADDASGNEAATKNTNDEAADISAIKQAVKRANNDVTVKENGSQSPNRPRGRAAGAQFPSNSSRSVSPAARGRRGASPAPGSQHRRTASSDDVKAPRSQSTSPSLRRARTTNAVLGSSRRQIGGDRTTTNSSHQRQARTNHHSSQSQQLRTSKTREKPAAEPEATATSDAEDENSVKGPRMSIANAFDMANKKNRGAGSSGNESDSSSLNSEADNKTVLQFDPANVGSISSFKRTADDLTDNESGVFKMETLKNKEEDDLDGTGHDGSYLPGSMQNKAGTTSPHSDGGGRKRRTSRRQSARNRSRRERSHSQSRERGGPNHEGSRKETRTKKRSSLRVEDVFNMNKSESCVDDSQIHARRGPRRSSGNESASSFSGNESERRRSRRNRVRRKLREKDHDRPKPARGDKEGGEDSDEGSVYLPANMRSLSPVPRPKTLDDDPNNDSHGGLTTDTDEGEDSDSSKRRRSSAFSYVKKQLKNQKNHLKSDLSAFKGKVKNYRDIGNGSSSSAMDASDSELHDPYNKKIARTDSKKGVGKKLKGLFQGNKKKHVQMLGESDSDYSTET